MSGHDNSPVEGSRRVLFHTRRWPFILSVTCYSKWKQQKQYWEGWNLVLLAWICQAVSPYFEYFPSWDSKFSSLETTMLGVEEKKPSPVQVKEVSESTSFLFSAWLGFSDELAYERRKGRSEKEKKREDFLFKCERESARGGIEREQGLKKRELSENVSMIEILSWVTSSPSTSKKHLWTLF